MTAKNAIDEVGILIPNSLDTSLLLNWLTRLEKYVSVEIEGLDCDCIKDITESEINEKLRIPDPFSSVYTLFLQSMVHLVSGENSRYTSIYGFYNNALSSYAKWYQREKSKWIT